jgi:hypothetical protein
LGVWQVPKRVKFSNHLKGRLGGVCFQVNDRAWFVYANGISDSGGFDNVLRFRTILMPHDGRRDWVPQTFRNAVSMVEASIEPPPGENCNFCQFADQWKDTKSAFKSA